MTEPARYVLDGRVDNYGWQELDAPPNSTPVATAGPFGPDSHTLSLPARQTPPNVLNRVNGTLKEANCFLAPLGVHGGNALLSVLDLNARPRVLSARSKRSRLR